MLTIRRVNASYIHIQTTQDIELELQDSFSFKVPGYKFTPAFKSGGWSGDIKLFNRVTKRIYGGLFEDILQFAKDREYPVSFNESEFPKDDITPEEVNDFLDMLEIPDIFERRDYQIQAIVEAINSRRATMLSPTASGKSFMIYSLFAYFSKKTLLIVPNVGLVNQMEEDFKAYGYKEEIHKVFAGQDKNTDLPITISTWQSLMTLPEEYFHQFEMVICDEVHGAKAKHLTQIMEKCALAHIRFGFTGTLDGTVTNKMIIQGLFGAVKQVTETHILMELGFVSKLAIKAVIFKYPDEIRKMVSLKGKDKPPLSYPQEIDYLLSCAARNRFIIDLAIKSKGNTLIIVNYVEKHGDRLMKLLKEKVGDTRPVYYVHGSDDANAVRSEIENADGAIIISTFKKFSTGLNIKRLHNIIVASPIKAQITLLQAIGRVLRLADDKEIATLFDIGDDLSWKSRKNYTIKHLLERIKIYNSQKFSYKTHNVEFKG